MKNIKKELFGITLVSLLNSDKKVKIIEIDKSETEGLVNGYSRGYILNGEMTKPAVQIYTEKALYRILIENIDQLSIEE